MAEAMRDPGAERGHEPGAKDQGHRICATVTVLGEPSEMLIRTAVAAPSTGRYVDDCRGERNQVQRIPRTPQQRDRRQHAGEDQRPCHSECRCEYAISPPAKAGANRKGQVQPCAERSARRCTENSYEPARPRAPCGRQRSLLIVPLVRPGSLERTACEAQSRPNQSAGNHNQNDHIRPVKGRDPTFELSPVGLVACCAAGPGSGPGPVAVSQSCSYLGPETAARTRWPRDSTVHPAR
jgi:hypothetical protein